MGLIAAVGDWAIGEILEVVDLIGSLFGLDQIGDKFA